MGLSQLTQETLERLISRSTDIVVATDRAGRVIYYNDGASRILGFKIHEILGHNVVTLYPSLAEAQRVMKAMRGDGHGGRGIVETFQTTFRSKSGEDIPVAISGTLLHDAKGNEDGTIGFAKDLREILRKDQLATLGEVAVGLSHEINNPLGVIVNQIELLEHDLFSLAGEGDVSVECERLDAMRREVGRISRVLSRLGEQAESETYETINYVGPVRRMIDLREKAEASEPLLAGVRVLVVDDDLGICQSVKEILEAAGCEVFTAHDGAAGLRCVESQPLDVVLSDVVMPEMDGYELYITIHKTHPHLPVLMMTGFHYDRDHVIKRSRLEGLGGVIFKKPVDPKRLIEVIVETVGKKAGAPPRSA
jgi:PAS domain S-box-containing protein